MELTLNRKTIISLICLNLITSSQFAVSKPQQAIDFGHIEEIKGLVKRGAYSKARPLMHQLLINHPDDTSYHLVAARLYKKMGLWSRAITEYEWIRQKHPKLAEPYIALSEMYMENLSSDIALSMAEEATYLAPNSQDAVSQLIKALIANHEYQRAESELESLIDKFPNDANVMHLAFTLRKDTGDYKEAKKFLDKAIKLRPEKLAWLLDLYDVSMAQHDTKGAKFAINAYLKESPDSIEALLKKAWLAEIYLYDYQEARLAYEKVISLDPENWVSEAGLERVIKKQSDVAETVKRCVRRFISDLIGWIGSFFQNASSDDLS